MAIPISEPDMLRWAIHYRDDILQHVSPRDHMLSQEDEHCPFLTLSSRGVHVCRIYRIRPGACARFPLSKEQAERVGCLGTLDGCADVPS